LRRLTKNAEQLTSLRIWPAILARAFKAFLGPRVRRTPPRLARTWRNQRWQKRMPSRPLSPLTAVSRITGD
jgi:hypothetical protein